MKLIADAINHLRRDTIYIRITKKHSTYLLEREQEYIHNT